LLAIGPFGLRPVLPVQTANPEKYEHEKFEDTKGVIR
jgi:hypothetical protein